MNKWTLAALLAAACIAGVTGGVIAANLAANAQPVNAQTAPIKIGLLNIEKVARATPTFTHRKELYEDNKKFVVAEEQKLKQEMDILQLRIRDARAKNATIEAENFEVELKAKQEEAKFAQDFHKHYLSELRDKFLKDVLQQVYNEAFAYAKKRGYHIVFQEYTLEEAKEDLFSGRAWSQSLMNKPVLAAPSAVPNAPNPNPFVFDFTDDLEKQAQGWAVVPPSTSSTPPKEPEQPKDK